MSPSWILRPNDPPEKSPQVLTMQKPASRASFVRRHPLLIGFLLLLVAIGLGVGLGVGLTIGKDSDSASPTPSPSSSPSPSSTPSPTRNTTGTFWQPSAGSTWQIVLLNPLNDTSHNVDVYDIDLFTNPTSTIDDLHTQNRKVICYFSAGSYEDGRPDSGNFTASDKGKELDGWPGEYWLDTNSANVRAIMKARLSLAATKGCDGVDPDNIDGYDNSNGLSLTQDSAIDYLTFLSDEAHALNLAIGLKNGGAIINQTIGMMEWEVNEQCVQFNECDLFRPFIDADKPVFHIEYPESAPHVTASTKSGICDTADAKGFSTLLKNMDLDEWVDAC